MQELKYLACVAAGPVALVALGAAPAAFGAHSSELPDLLVRTGVSAVLAILVAWLLFRPLGYALRAGTPLPAARLRLLPSASAMAVALLSALAIATHLAKVHGSDLVPPASLALHAGVLAAYVGLLVYFLLLQYVLALRFALWREHQVLVLPGRRRLSLRLALGFAAVGAAPLLFVTVGHPSLPDAASGEVQAVRRVMQMDLLAAALLAAALMSLTVRSLARPLQLLMATMESIDGGNASARAPVISDDELGTLAARFNRMVDALAERERMRRTFSRFVPEAVAARLIADEGAISPQEREASVLYVDIEGFTAFVAASSPRDVLRMLNAHFERLAQSIHAAGGVITQFQGDAVLACFGLPAPLPDAAVRAVEAALAIASPASAPTHGLRVRVGVATGVVVGGTVGGGDRLSYTVHGETVNLAARLEQLNKDLGTRILVDGRTAARLNGRLALREHGPAAIRGITEPVRVFEPRSNHINDPITMENT